MKLWHVSQTAESGYDTYSDLVVAAETELEAKSTHPSGHDLDPDTGQFYTTNRDGSRYISSYPSWALNISQVDAKLIGTAEPGVEAGIICESFHAG